MTETGSGVAVREAGGAVRAGGAAVAGLAFRPVAGVDKHAQVAGLVRALVENGALRPGEPAPSGPALARVTGFSEGTCRRGLRDLVRDGILVPGLSRSARPLVPSAPGAPAGRLAVSAAARALSAGLASRRRAAGLTQPELAAMLGRSLTTVGHAETGRLWQGCDFWEAADKALNAGGELVRLRGAWQFESVPSADGPRGDHAGGMDGREPGELLTADEREVVRLLGLAYTILAARVVAHGPTRDGDLAELRAPIHVVQRAVEAQAAARAYPREFRLLGTVIPKTLALGTTAGDAPA